MTTDLEMKRDPSVLIGITVGVVSVVLLVVIVLGLETLYYRTAEREQWRKTVERQPVELLRLRESQRGLLEGYRLVDAEQAVAAVPIERAMEMVVADQGRPVSAPSPRAPQAATGAAGEAEGEEKAGDAPAAAGDAP